MNTLFMAMETEITILSSFIYNPQIQTRHSQKYADIQT